LHHPHRAGKKLALGLSLPLLFDAPLPLGLGLGALFGHGFFQGRQVLE
jgi:hypothetical protein